MIYLTLNPITLQLEILDLPSPYVYKGICHKQGDDFGKIYFGSRWLNVTCKNINNRRYAKDDLGKFYFTSSKKIKEIGFENFTWEILSEYQTPEEAYWEEQKLIKLNFKNILILNGNFVDPDSGNKAFKSSSGWKHSEKGLRNLKNSQPDRSGKNNSNYGKKTSFDKAEKIRKSLQDKTLFIWIHETEGKELLTLHDMIKKYSQLKLRPLRYIAHTRNKKYKGWTVYNTKLEIKDSDIIFSGQKSKSRNKNSDNTVYHWRHKDGREEICPRFFLIRKYSLNSGNITLVIQDKHKTCEGWSIVN